mmetsp:Transcript_14257/g.48778  ORF Transcript_14257/g.48778 Transcript_14257/m.48778 type:complete len:143 (-) Transcript_14257:91-519(-)
MREREHIRFDSEQHPDSQCFKQKSPLYRVFSSVQQAWDRLFPDSVDWELGWKLHLKALGQVDASLPPAEKLVPRVYAKEKSRKLDYIMGVAEEALKARAYDRARELVAEAKLSCKDEEFYRTVILPLGRRIEEEAINDPYAR